MADQLDSCAKSIHHNESDNKQSVFIPIILTFKPGKTITAKLIGGAKPGKYLYRDGTMQIFSGGVWGHFNVEPVGGHSIKKNK